MNSETFDLNLLRVFDALMRHRSVSVAATRLNLTQPAISNALTRMRRISGDQLFVRSRKGMEPTPYALQIGPPIQEGLATIRKGLAQPAGFDPQTSDRRFTLLMTDVGQVVFLPRLLPRIAAAGPHVDIKVLQLPRDDYAGALENGLADLAIGSQSLGRGYYQQELFGNRYVALFRGGHPSLGRVKDSRVPLDAYLAAPHVTVTPPSAMGNPVERAMDENGWTRRVALEVPHFMVLAHIIPQTDLVATVPDKVVPSLGKVSGLRSAELPFAVQGVNIRQNWHARQHEDPGNRWLRRVVAGLFELT